MSSVALSSPLCQLIPVMEAMMTSLVGVLARRGVSVLLLRWLEIVEAKRGGVSEGVCEFRTIDEVTAAGVWVEWARLQNMAIVGAFFTVWVAQREQPVDWEPVPQTVPHDAHDGAKSQIHSAPDKPMTFITWHGVPGGPYRWRER
ncbi:hypothetical protein BC826DRAFT_327582 [Russula brevipes]|nr:hypothetical protein BC826DRAFT_327582 [Russula brevipes]